MAGVLPWSYSSLSAFETCPRRYYLTRIAKVVQEPQTQATVWGNEVHKALELAVKDGTPLAPRFVEYTHMVERLRAAEGTRHTETKFGLTSSYTPTTFFAKDVWFRGVIDLAIVTPKVATVLDHKGLALDTRIPTPTGWTTVGELRVGDQVIGGDGRPCNVVGKSALRRRPCFEVVFETGERVVADDEHLWLVNGKIVSTAWMAENVFTKGKRPQRHLRVDLAPSWDLPDTALPIEPYLLGVWLGDGKHTSGEICKPDEDLWANLRARGHNHGSDTSGVAGGRARSSTVYGLRTRLRTNNLLSNKHIPIAYLRASRRQREELLRGLMDTDGSVNLVRGQCVFSTTDRALAMQVRELLISLGQRPLLSSVRATGFGKVVQAYPITFRPVGGFNPFDLPRKRDKVRAWRDTESRRRLVQEVISVPTVPTQCIAVDSPDRTYLCTESGVVTHNTGKVKSDGDQLKLFAAAAFAQYPFVERVQTGYLWLAHNKVTRRDFHPEDVPMIWQEFVPRVRRMELAQERDQWLPNPSGLCKAYCPVGRKLCDFCGKD